MYKVIIDDEAEKDLFHIFAYICHCLMSPSTAQTIYSNIKEAINSLAELPNRAPIIEKEPYSQEGVRKLLIKNYIAFYVVNEDSHEVHVLRVLYGKRDWRHLI